jgi:hypothetical protein
VEASGATEKMPRAKEDSSVKSMSIKEIKAQLDSLTSRLKEYECTLGLRHNDGSNFLTDGLRLSQEVEILKKQNVALRRENEALRKELAACCPDAAHQCCPNS